MRIIAGQFKSRPLKSLRGRAMRPTADRLRETLFNILGAAVEGSIFIDCFAGTGAVGIEAISRGARQVIFIDNHRPAVGLIRANLASLGLTSGFEIFSQVALHALESLSARGLRADFIFFDPPYAERKAYAEALSLLDSQPLLVSKGCAIIEHATKHPLPERLLSLHRWRLVAQGDSALAFYRK